MLELFRTARPVTETLEGVAYDSILTEETTEEAKARMARRRADAD